MSVVDKLIIQVSFDEAGFDKSAQKVNETIKKVSKTTESELGKNFDKKKFEDQSKVVVNIMEGTAKNIGSVLTKGLAGLGTVIGAKFALDFVQAFGEKSKNLELGASTLNYNRQGGQLIERLFGRIGSSQNAGGALSNLSKSINSYTGNSNLAKFLGIIGKTVFDQNGQKKSTDVLLAEIIEGLHNYGKVAGKDKQLAAFNEVGIFPPEVLKLAQLDQKRFQALIKDIIPTLASDETLEKGINTAEKWAALNDRIAALQANVGDHLYSASEKLVGLFEYLSGAIEPIGKFVNSVSDIFGAHIGIGNYRAPSLKYDAKDLQDPRKRAIIESQQKNEDRITGYFSRLYKNAGSSLSNIGNGLKDISPFFKTYQPAYKLKLSQQNPRSIDDILNVIGQKESNNGKNTNDGIYKEGSQFRGYGKYQVTPQAFKDVHGREITDADKLNSALLDETARKYLQLGREKYGAMTIEEQLAFWNGGPEGIEIARNGYNVSDYTKRRKAENLRRYVARYNDTGILATESPTVNQTPAIPSAALSTQSVVNNDNKQSVNNKSVVNNFHGDIQLPGVKDTTDFAKKFGSIGDNDGAIYGFSRGYT